MMGIRSNWVCAGVLFAALLGCDASPFPEESASGEIRIEDVRLVGTNALIHEVRDMAFDAAGRLWVLTGFEPFIHVLDPAGELVAQFGRRGDGPGELRNPWYLLQREGSSVPAIWDVGTRRVVHLSVDGELRSEIRIEVPFGTVLAGYRRTEFGEPLRMAQVDSGLILEVYDGQVVRSGDLWNGRLVRIARPGEDTGVLVRYDALLKDGERSPSPVIAPGPLWTVCGESYVVVLDPEAGQLRWLDGSGTSVKLVDLELPRRPVLREDLERYVWNGVEAEAGEAGLEIDRSSPDLRQLVDEMIRSLEASLPPTAPPVRLRCDDGGRTWVQLYSTDRDPRGYGDRWLVVDEDRSRVVAFPDGFQPLRFVSDQVLGYMEDELGVQTPAVTVLPDMVLNPAERDNGV